MTPSNPLYNFHFCPLCGAPDFEEHAPNARKCKACGFTYYANPRGATVAIIHNDRDEFLVATRAKNPAQGTLDMVGGFLDLDENAEQGMCREIAEETGLIVAPEQLHYLFSQVNHYTYSGITLHTCDLFFELRVAGRPEVKAHDDVAQLQWIPRQQLRIADFGFESIRQGLARLLGEVADED